MKDDLEILFTIIGSFVIALAFILIAFAIINSLYFIITL